MSGAHLHSPLLNATGAGEPLSQQAGEPIVTLSLIHSALILRYTSSIEPAPMAKRISYGPQERPTGDRHAVTRAFADNFVRRGQVRSKYVET